MYRVNRIFILYPSSEAKRLGTSFVASVFGMENGEDDLRNLSEKVANPSLKLTHYIMINTNNGSFLNSVTNLKLLFFSFYSALLDYRVVARYFRKSESPGIQILTITDAEYLFWIGSEMARGSFEQTSAHRVQVIT